MSEEILRTILTFTNRKARELRRKIRKPDATSLPFQFLFELVVIVTTLLKSMICGSLEIVNHFTMSVHRFKFLLRCNIHEKTEKRMTNLLQFEKCRKVSVLIVAIFTSLMLTLICDNDYLTI